jgi:hypothetical protein
MGSETGTLAAPGAPYKSLNPNGIAGLTPKNSVVCHTDRQIILREFRSWTLVCMDPAVGI